MEIALGFFIFFVILCLFLWIVNPKGIQSITWEGWIDEKETSLERFFWFTVFIGILIHQFLDLKELSYIVIGIGTLLAINERLKR